MGLCLLNAHLWSVALRIESDMAAGRGLQHRILQRRMIGAHIDAGRTSFQSEPLTCRFVAAS